MIYLQLFYEFFKTGLFAVGGGLATLPFLYDMADRTGWFTRPQLADMLAVSESTPGPIGVNMATYVGFVTRGIPGAIISTLGLVTPSVIVILIIAAFLKAFRHNRYVEAAFYGLRPASTAMVAAAGLSVVAITLLNTGAAGLAIVNWKALALAAVILVLTRWVPFTKKLHPIVFIAAAAVVGVVFPSLVIIAALAGVITTFSHLAWVQHAFAGIRVCVCVLIFNAVLKLWKGAVKDVWGLVIFLVILALSVFTKLSPIIYVLAAAVAGLLIKNLGAKRS